MTSEKYKIGWIGLGKMGNPMSKQILKAGLPLRVYNRSSDKMKALETEGASTATTAKSLVEQTDVIFLMVSDDEAVKEIFNQENGIFSAEVKDKIFINTSTISPDLSIHLSEELKKRNSHYLDAPVSGSVKQAEEATLISIVGGEKAIFDKVHTIFEAYSKKAILVGKNGVGNSAKLAVNTYLGILTEGLAEIIQFSKTKNVDPRDLMQIINNSALGSTFGKIKGEAAINENYNAAFTLEHLTKDLRLAQNDGFNHPVGNAAYKSFSNAEAELGQEDVISIIKKLS